MRFTACVNEHRLVLPFFLDEELAVRTWRASTSSTVWAFRKTPRRNPSDIKYAEGSRQDSFPRSGRKLYFLGFILFVILETLEPFEFEKG